MGRLLSGSVKNRGIANRPSLPHSTPSLSSGASSSSSSESCYSSAYDSGEEARESSRAEVAQRMAPPAQRQQQQRSGRGMNIASSNGLVLPWANGAGCTIVTASTRRIPLSTPRTAAATTARGYAKKRKRPVLPVSLDSISKDLSKGLNPSQFVQNAHASPQVVTARETEMARNINERSQVQAMLAEQQRQQRNTASSSSSEESSSSGTGKRRRRRSSNNSSSSSSSSASSSSPSSSSSRRKARRTPPLPLTQRSGGNPSSNEDIAEDEFFQRDGSGSSSSSSSSSGSEEDDGRPNFYRVRRRKKTADPRVPEEPPKNLCFGCMWGHRQFDRVASTKLNGLADIFDSHFLTSEPRELAYLIYLYYQAEIYLPGIKGGKRFPEWTHGQILIHIEEHILEPRVFVARSIRKCIKIQRALEMFLFEEDEETHRRTYDEKAMKTWLLFNKRQLDLHNCDCKHMFGYSESMQINPSQLSRVIHADRYEVVNNKRGRANVYS